MSERRILVIGGLGHADLALLASHGIVVMVVEAPPPPVFDLAALARKIAEPDEAPHVPFWRGVPNLQKGRQRHGEENAPSVRARTPRRAHHRQAK
jgi:hypothetical protein